MNFFHRLALHHLGPALRVVDVQPEKQLHDGVKPPAGESPVAGLRLMNDRIRQPARADDAVRAANVPDQIQERPRRRRPVGIHVADQIAEGGELEAFDERAALANRLLEFQHPKHRRKFRRDPPNHSERVVGAAVEHDDELEFAGIIFLEKLRVVAQHRFDAALLVVSRNQEQQTGIRHADSVTANQWDNQSWETGAGSLQPGW